MKRRIFLGGILAPAAVVAAARSDGDGKSGRIEHTVMFSLKHGEGSDGEKKFLEDSKKILGGISGVENFKVRRQINPKNPHKFCFSMEFASRKEYDFYNNNPSHLDYVKNRWFPEVESFLEADFPAE